MYFSIREIQNLLNINRNYVTFGALVIITINLSSCGLTVKGFASLFDKIVYSDWNIVIIYTEDKMISLIFSGPDCWRSQSLRKLITQDALELFSSSLHFLLCAKIILLSIWKGDLREVKNIFYFKVWNKIEIASPWHFRWIGTSSTWGKKGRISLTLIKN